MKTYIFRCEFMMTIHGNSFVNVEYFYFQAIDNIAAWHAMNDYRKSTSRITRKIELIGILEGMS